ncbi:MAG TPA: gas vesicle protein GvpJ [Actinomycetes bacterium]|nr:gas vesicle protein GvpJ [Actinomycetes bacterium]
MPTAERPGILGGTTSSGTSLVDLLDRVVQRGAFVSGDVTICLAGIDLVRLDLRLLLTGITGIEASDTRDRRAAS